jgi:uncharacterized protein YqhQ
MRVLSSFIHNLTDKGEERKAENEMQRRLAIVIVMSLLFSVFVVFIVDAIADRNTSLMFAKFAKDDLLIHAFSSSFRSCSTGNEVVNEQTRAANSGILGYI